MDGCMGCVFFNICCINCSVYLGFTGIRRGLYLMKVSLDDSCGESVVH
jgi:hypothetical protein